MLERDLKGETKTTCVGQEDASVSGVLVRQAQPFSCDPRSHIKSCLCEFTSAWWQCVPVHTSTEKEMKDELGENREME